MVAKQLKDEGHRIGRHKARRIMRQMGLWAQTPQRFKLTTDSQHSFPVTPHVLNRRFDVNIPNKVYTADITYVQTFDPTCTP